MKLNSDIPEHIYVVRCRVSGGITGTRESLLKDGTGAIVHFPTMRTAEKQAEELTKKMNHPDKIAKYEYWADVL